MDISLYLPPDQPLFERSCPSPVGFEYFSLQPPMTAFPQCLFPYTSQHGPAVRVGCTLFESEILYRTIDRKTLDLHCLPGRPEALPRIGLLLKLYSGQCTSTLAVGCQPKAKSNHEGIHSARWASFGQLLPRAINGHSSPGVSSSHYVYACSGIQRLLGFPCVRTGY